MKRCDICVDPKCGGEQNCNCDACPVVNECHRVLRPIIRITTKCTQACSHCAFTCSPKSNDMMSIETAQEIDAFLTSNNINTISIMGGEFWLNPNWLEIVKIITGKDKYVRLVTNGDWAKNPEATNDIITFAKHYDGIIKISLSRDKWHHNKHVDEAAKLLKDNEILFNISTEEETTDNAIVPIGRSEFEYNFFTSFGAYCVKDECRYVFLITEEGSIRKCPFGLFNFDHVHNYTEGKFAKRFKEFNTAFYKGFISNCRSCHRMHDTWERKQDRD